MERKDFPNAAFGYVSDDGATRLLLHHDPERVKNGKEHGTVDPVLLYAALQLVDVVPMSDEQRKRVRSHLRGHAEVLFAFSPEEGDGTAPDYKLWEDEDTDRLPIAMQDKLRDYAFFKAHLDGAAETPPVQTEGRGSAYIAYNKRTKEMSWWIQFLGLTSAENAAHFHIGRGGKPGPIEIPIGVGNPKVGSQVLTEDQEKALFEGNIFLNIHSSSYPAGEIRGQVMPTVTSRGNHSVSAPPKEPNPEPQFQENIQIEPDRKSGDGGPDVSKPPAETRLNPDRGGGPSVSKPPKDEAPQATVQENISVEKDRKSGGGGPEVVKPTRDTVPQPVIMDPEPTGSRKPSGGGPEVTTPPGEVTPRAQVRRFDPPIYSKDLYTSESGFVDFGRPLLNIMIDGDSPIFGEETSKNIMKNQNQSGAPNPPKASSDAERVGFSVSNLTEDKELAKLVNQGGSKAEVQSRVTAFMKEQGFAGRLVIFASQSKANEKSSMKVLKIECSPSTSSLPDAAFAVIERGGKRSNSKTKPFSLRHLPHHTGAVKDPNENISIDLPRLRNALARMNQIKAHEKDNTARIQRVAKSHLIKHAKAALPTSKFAKSDVCRLSDVIAELDEAILQLVGSGAIKAVAKLEVSEESVVKMFRLDMSNGDSNDVFFVRVRFDGNSKAKWVEFDFDTILPARAIPDFTKFLKSLPQE